MTAPEPRHMPGGKRGILVAGVVLSSFLLAACKDNQYLARRDTITLGAGDAAAANRVIHTIDPWPRYAKNKDFTTDGKRMMVGVTRYQENKSLEPEGADTTERFKKDDSPKDPPPGPPPGG